MDTADMFPSENEPAAAKAPGSGLLVTNHLNLMYMLAAGLLMPPAGFGGKYYRDTVGCFPGWIPLFIGKAPGKAIESCTSEAGHLKPVIVELDLSGLSGNVAATGEDGPRERHFPDQIDGTERLLLVPAPLPIARIESIVFWSAEEKRACEADAKDFANVPLKEFKLRTQRALFTKAPDIPWPPLGEGPPERAAPLQGPLAAGGVMAMLLRFANLGEQAVRACRTAFDPDDGDAPRPADDHPILAGLGAWIRDGTASLPASADPETDRIGLQKASQARLFWEAVARLVEWRDTSDAGGAEDVLIDHLDAAVGGLDPRLQAGIRKLHDTLASLTGLAGASAGELFERHDTPLAHAMTLFLLRRDCADLFDYDTGRLAERRLSEPDWLAAAILFGVRDGWMNLPLRLRAGRALSDAVSHRMARMSHRIAGTGFDLGAAPPRVRPLRELFGDGSTWRSREKSAAQTLARAQKWDCVRTRIGLGPGEYTLTVKGGATYIDLPGEPRISPEIDLDRFFESLAGARLDPEAEAKVRAALGD